MVSIPERTSHGDRLQSVKVEASCAFLAARALQRCVDPDRVGLALGADPLVAGEDLVSQVPGIGTQAPLVHAVVGAEGAASRVQDLELAPAAEGTAMLAERKGRGADAAAGKGAWKQSHRRKAYDESCWTWKRLCSVTSPSLGFASCSTAIGGWNSRLQANAPGDAREEEASATKRAVTRAKDQTGTLSPVIPGRGFCR